MRAARVVLAGVGTIVVGWLALVAGFVALVYIDRWLRVRRGEDVR